MNDKLKSYCFNGRKDPIGKCDYELFNTHHAETFLKEDMEVLNGNGFTFQYIKPSLHKGKRFIYLTCSTLLVSPSNRRFIIGLVNDITDYEEIKENLQCAKERAEQSDKLKSAFLANMSHEIRTPLNAIIGFSNLIGGNIPQEERDEYTKIININSEMLLNLINEVLDLSKIEAGMMEYHYEEFDLALYFNELMTSFCQSLKNPEVEMVVSNPYEHCMLFYDKKRYTQVLTNFVTNAIKYTEKGYIKIGYEISGESIRTYVEDTGLGISDDKQDRVFGRFEKLNDFAQGTGLGLAIAKEIAEHDGGSIGFRSKQGVGSEFWFYILKRKQE